MVRVAARLKGRGALEAGDRGHFTAGHGVAARDGGAGTRRARALFEREGIRVIPAPTDHEVVDRPFELLDVVPAAEALEGSGRAIKEIVGAWAGS